MGDGRGGVHCDRVLVRQMMRRKMALSKRNEAREMDSEGVGVKAVMGGGK